MLDIERLLPDWTYGKHMLLNLYTQIENMFLDISILQDTNSFNKEIAELLLANSKEFEKIISKTVADSI